MNGHDPKPVADPRAGFPPAGGPRDLSTVPTEKLVSVQQGYLRRMQIAQDQETQVKAQLIGQELMIRKGIHDILEDVAKQPGGILL